MPIVLDGSLGVTTPMYNGTITANAVTPSVNMKNRLINSAMTIDQRNAGASGSTFNTYSLDRWYVNNNSGSSRFTWQQNAGAVTPPTGFTNYYGITSTSSYSITSTNVLGIYQAIEGFNIADLGWGTANAATVTLSFWVRSSLTGTFGGVLKNGANTASYPYTYTISAANTWEQKSVTIAGPTIGTWPTNNSAGMEVWFSVGTGSTFSGTAGAWAGSGLYSATGATSVVGTNGATFYITGVQLEVGSTATSFDYRPIGTELALCQRYFQTSFPIGTAPAQNAGGTGAIYCQGQAASSPASCQVVFPVQMRTTPSTFTTFNPSAANANWRNITASSDITVSLYSSGATGAFISSSAQVMNQYAVSGIHYSATAEL